MKVKMKSQLVVRKITVKAGRLALGLKYKIKRDHNLEERQKRKI